jgi:hypothetical protein
MDKESIKILQEVGIEINELDSIIIPREQLLCFHKYEHIQKLIPNLKHVFSSSFMTSLQNNCLDKQKFPLLNLVRQILCVYGYTMKPIRKSDGYTKEGVKKYKRYFQIDKNVNNY